MNSTDMTGNPRPFGKDEKAMPDEDPADLESGTVEATPEEQAQYDLVVARAIKFMHGEGKDQTLKMLGSGELPAQSIGQTAVMIVRAIEDSAKQAGKPLDNDVLFNAGVEIVEELGEYGATAGVFQFNDQEEAQRQVEEGLFWAMKIYGEDALQRGDAHQEEALRAVQENIAREQGMASPAGGVQGAVSNALAPKQPVPGAEAISNPGLIRQQMGV